MKWRLADNDEKNYIRGSYLKKEIISIIITGLFDVLLLITMTAMLVKFSDIITCFVCAFLGYIFFVTLRAIIRSVRSISYIKKDDLKIADCKVDNVDTKTVGLIKSAYVTVVEKSGETYSMNYTSPFVSNIVKGQKVFLVQLGSAVEMILT
jgi:hypothetical protein